MLGKKTMIIFILMDNDISSYVFSSENLNVGKIVFQNCVIKADVK